MPKKSTSQSKTPPRLQQRTEAAARASQTAIASMKREDVLRLVDELQVSQIQLEMQNQELRRAQEELVRSRDRLNDLYEFAPVGYLTLDPAQKVVEANLTLATMLGVGRDKLVGRKFTRFVARAGQDTFVRHERAALDGEGRHVCDLLLRRADGTTFFARLETVGVPVAGSLVPHCRSAIVDNTERQQTREALQQSEARYRMLHESMRDAFASVDMKGRILEFNSAFRSMVGYTAEELLTRTYADLTPKKWHAMEAEIVAEQILPRGYSAVYEKEYRRKDGTVFPVELRTFLIRDAAGQPSVMWATVRDITERKHAEEELRQLNTSLEGRVAERTALLKEREESLRAILNTVGDAIITIDGRGLIIGVNPATTRIFGYREEELAGRNVSILMPSPYREEHDGSIARYLATGEARIIGLGREALGQRKNGAIFPIDIAVTQVDHAGIFTGVIRDITERKRLEAEVLRIAGEERQRLAADLHDGICQELTGVSWLTNLLRRDLQEARDPRTPRVRLIEKAIIRAIEQTRQVARSMKPVVGDGSGLRHALQRLAVATAQTHRIRCPFECPIPVSIEDATVANELYRIAQEAIYNARRHGHAKRITVRLSDGNGEVCLAVVDNGRGLPADVANVPGMGLRVMKYRAGLIRGHLTIQPRERGGTEVVCRVPISHVNS